MIFNLITQYFEKINKTDSRNEMALILYDLFEQTPVSDIQNLIYFCEGKIGPTYKGREINIGQATIISVVARYLGQPSSTIKHKFQELGDLGLVVEQFKNVNKQATLFSRKLDFNDVYNTLKEITEITGKGAIEKKIKLFESLIFNLDRISVKYIVRFPISFRLGFSDSTIIEALSYLDKSVDQKLAKKIISKEYNLVSDLGLIAKIIKKDGVSNLNKSIIKFIPIKPALCERAKSFEEIKERLGENNKKFIVDSKIDGFRQQIHKFRDTVKIFSRNEEDITSMFPNIVKKIKEIPKDFVIDCEAIAYDPINKKYHDFQTTMQRRRKYDIDEKSKELPLHLKVFDVLYYDSKSLVDIPYIERRKILEEHFNKPPIIQPTEQIITNSVDDLKKFFDSRISQGLEGIIAKSLDAGYSAGSRGFNWIKFKKSYDNVHDTIDGVIVGGFYGQGKRSDNGIGALLIGIFDSTQNKYYTIAKLGSGLTDDILEDLSKKLKDLEVIKKPSDLITNIDADFYVAPKIVVEINFDGITRSSLHTVCYDQKTNQGLALRFPRFVRFRVDKSEIQTTTPEEVQRLYDLQI